MILAEKIVTALCEGDDEDIKGILGHEYLEPASVPTKKGDVYRHDRWMDVSIGNTHFCISYLTPVAFFDPDGQHVVRSDREWSISTIRHIKKWLDHLGFDVSDNKWPEIKRRFPSTLPQAQLADFFRKQSQQVNWSKKQVRSYDAIPYNRIKNGLNSGGRDYKVELYPDSPPTQEY